MARYFWAEKGKFDSESVFKLRAFRSSDSIRAGYRIECRLVEVSRAASTAGSLSRDGTTSGRELRGHHHWCVAEAAGRL